MVVEPADTNITTDFAKKKQVPEFYLKMTCIILKVINNWIITSWKNYIKRNG